MSTIFDPNCTVVVSFAPETVPLVLKTLFPNTAQPHARGAVSNQSWQELGARLGVKEYAKDYGLRQVKDYQLAPLQDVETVEQDLERAYQLLAAFENTADDPSEVSNNDADDQPLAQAIKKIGQLVCQPPTPSPEANLRFAKWFVLELNNLSIQGQGSLKKIVRYRKAAQNLAAQAFSYLDSQVEAAFLQPRQTIVVGKTVLDPVFYYVFDSVSKELLSIPDSSLQKVILQCELIRSIKGKQQVEKLQLLPLVQMVQAARDGVKLSGETAATVVVARPAHDFETALLRIQHRIDHAQRELDEYQKQIAQWVESKDIDNPITSTDLRATIDTGLSEEFYQIGTTLGLVIDTIPIIGPIFSNVWTIFTTWTKPKENDPWVAWGEKFTNQILDTVSNQIIHSKKTDLQTYLKNWDTWLGYNLSANNKPLVQVTNPKQKLPNQVLFNNLIYTQPQSLRDHFHSPLTGGKGQFRTLPLFESLFLTLTDVFRTGMGYEVDGVPTANPSLDSTTRLKEYFFSQFVSDSMQAGVNGEHSIVNYFIKVSNDIEDYLNRYVFINKEEKKSCTQYAIKFESKYNISPAFTIERESIYLGVNHALNLREAMLNYARACLRLMYMAQLAGPVMLNISKLLDKFNFPNWSKNKNTFDPWVWWEKVEMPKLNSAKNYYWNQYNREVNWALSNPYVPSAEIPKFTTENWANGMEAYINGTDPYLKPELLPDFGDLIPKY